MATLLVTLRAGGTYEFAPEGNEVIRYQVADNKTLFIKKAVSNGETYPLDSEFEVFRIFADGVWADVELVD